MLCRVALLVGVFASQGCMSSMMFGWVPASSEEPEDAPTEELAAAPEPARCGPPTLHLAASASASARSEGGALRGRSSSTSTRSATPACDAGARR